MTVVRVKGFKIFKDRHGKQRCYHRASGTAVDLKRYPLGTAEFLSECARIGATLPGSAPPPRVGTLGALIAAYRGHARFAGLKPATRKGYQKVFDWLKVIDDLPLVRLSRKMVVDIRDKAEAKHGWHFANRVKLVLSVLFAWAAERGFVPFNYAAEIRAIKRPTGLKDVHRRWTDEEQRAVLAACSPVMRVPIALMMFMGLGPADALQLPRNRIRDGKIEYRREKTAEPYYWPLPEKLAAVLAEAPRHNAITVCASSRGKPWSLDGFHTVWQRLKAQLEEAGEIGDGLTLYGLRHSQAELLAELGFDPRTIADALGQATESMALRYSKRAKLGKKMEQVVKLADQERAKRETKVVKPA